MAMVFQCDICGKIQKATDERREFKISNLERGHEFDKSDICCNICMGCRDRIMDLVEKLKNGDETEAQRQDEKIYPYPDWCPTCLGRHLNCSCCTYNPVNLMPSDYKAETYE